MENGQPVVATTPNVTISNGTKYFQITTQDVGAAVAAQMKSQGYQKDVTATLTPANAPVFYAADHPLKLVVHALQVDTQASIWQGQAYILSNGKTEMVKPISGRFETTLNVPTLTRQFREGDIITESDIAYKTLPERQLRKDTIIKASNLIGQSPTRMVSPGRPIRSGEIDQPKIIKKGQLVEMNYTTPYMSIRTSGEALEDGSQGTLIRVKNSKTEKAISARVVASGKVEVNNDSTL